MFFIAKEASGLIFGLILIILRDRSFREPTIASKSLFKNSGLTSGNVLTRAKIGIVGHKFL
jgi:hypothetical protein